jgi:hypothetical protein
LAKIGTPISTGRRNLMAKKRKPRRAKKSTARKKDCFTAKICRYRRADGTFA